MAGNHSTPHPRSAAKKRTSWFGVLLGLGLGTLAAFHLFKLPPVLPILLELYDYSMFAAGGFMSIYAVIGLLASAFLGIQLQRHGMPRFLVSAAVMLIAGSTITLATPEMIPAMFVARALEGLGFAIIAVCAPVLAIASAQDRHKTIAIALFAAWIPAGQLIAMGVAQPFVEQTEWRPVWWIGIGFTLIIIALGWLAAGRHVPRRTASNASRQLPLKNFPRSDRLALILVATTFMLWSTEIFAMLTWLPIYLIEARGFAANTTILVYAVPSVLIFFCCIASGFVLRAGIPLPILLAGTLALQGAVWLALPILYSVETGLAGLIVFGAAAGLSATCLFAAPALIFGGANAGGSAFGVVMTGRNLGVLVGPILLPPVLIATNGWQGVGPVFGAISLAAAGTALALGGILKRRSADS